MVLRKIDDNMVRVRINFENLRREYIKFRRNVLLQTEFHKAGAGPLPKEGDYLRLAQLRTELGDLLAIIRQHEQRQKEREAESRKAALEARQRLAGLR